MKKYIFIILLGLSFQIAAQNTSSLLFTTPPEKVTLLGEGFLSTMINERDFALSPDGKELYYTVTTPKSTFQTIVFCKKIKEGTWTKPEVAPFAGEFSDLEPAFSADGQTIYFSSNRPMSEGGAKDFDIWKVTRTADGWAKPENLLQPINTPADEFYPSIAKTGNLYYTASYPGGPGREDIYMSALENKTYQKPVALDTMVNSRFYEFNAFVSPEENFILFTSYGRKDDTGGGDLYISIKDGQGKWQRAKNLKDLNSKQLDYCPFVSPDGKILFFTSERHQLPVSFRETKASYKEVAAVATRPLNGTGNIYWIDFKKVLDSVSK